ncbi:hypothetical protein AVEN_6040-1 [Araneus ventricosus]|uniref:Uncharacterized protein n=1 Tax=Araneus ventricosus TaxID=182803 RepID=A0A4Y2U141_ARAVE|nr:hypothetical protein AVEN_6040-1 [Araneus ventricosus]
MQRTFALGVVVLGIECSGPNCALGGSCWNRNKRPGLRTRWCCWVKMQRTVCDSGGAAGIECSGPRSHLVEAACWNRNAVDRMRMVRWCWNECSGPLTATRWELLVDRCSGPANCARWSCWCWNECSGPNCRIRGAAGAGIMQRTLTAHSVVLLRNAGTVDSSNAGWNLTCSTRHCGCCAGIE